MSDEITALKVGLDLGSHSFKAVVATHDENGALMGLSALIRPASGVRKGAVLNLEACVLAIEELLSDLEAECGNDITEVYLAFSGEHVEGQNSNGVANVGLRGKSRTITAEDVAKVIDSAQAVPLTENRELAMIIPTSYKVDNTLITKNPIQMQGVRLEARAHIISAPGSLLHNLTLAVNQAGRNVINLTYAPLAASYVLLNRLERSEGVLLIEMGASTTKLLFLGEGVIQYSTVLPIGAMALSRDFSEVENLPLELAETLKVEHGCCFKALLPQPAGHIVVPPFGGRGVDMVDTSKVCAILSARMNDIFTAALRRFERTGWLYKAKSVVLGGGGSQLPGASELAARLFELPTRAGYVMGIENLNDLTSSAQFASAWGLLKTEDLNSDQTEKKSTKLHESIAESPQKNALQWLKENFF
jgi:cell division protein FtsA